jgi:hypothetical protein
MTSYFNCASLSAADGKNLVYMDMMITDVTNAAEINPKILSSFTRKGVTSFS